MKTLTKLFVCLVCLTTMFGCKTQETLDQEKASIQYHTVCRYLPSNGRVSERLGNGWYTVRIPVEGKERVYLLKMYGTSPATVVMTPLEYSR